MVQLALAFTLGILIGFLYPRHELVHNKQDVELTCPDMPACPAAPECKPDTAFIKGIESYQELVSSCYRDLDRAREALDSCRLDNLNLKHDNDELRR
jgi:hypothetical protein